MRIIYKDDIEAFNIKNNSIRMTIKNLNSIINNYMDTPLVGTSSQNYRYFYVASATSIVGSFICNYRIYSTYSNRNKWGNFGFK